MWPEAEWTKPGDVGSMDGGVQGLFITASETRTSTTHTSEKEAEDSYSWQALLSKAISSNRMIDSVL